MALRTAHGNSRKHGRALVVETPGASELTVGAVSPPLPADPREGFAPLPKGDPYTHAVLARAREAKAAKRVSELAMLHGFGLEPGAVPPELLPYLDHAEDWCAAEVARVAREVGGGVASPSVAALVQQAGLALAHSRHATAEGRHADAVRYGQEVRANILAGHHLAALESKARGASQASSEAW
jgi:hypothetical protein